MRVAKSVFSQKFASVIEPNFIMVFLVGYEKISVKSNRDQSLCWGNEHKNPTLLD